MTKEKNRKEREEYLEAIKSLLNANFKATEVERYPLATLEFWISEYIDKFHDDRKKRISLKTQKKVHSAVVKKLRKMYGPWVTVRIRNPKKWGWDTNLGQVYKTENGRIYGTPLYDDLFITSHAIERWEERSSLDHWRHFDRAHMQKYHIAPSGLDRILFLFETAIQIGISNQVPLYRYLSVNGGVFVIEIFEGIMVVKTFLKYDMSIPPMIWYGIDAGEWLTNMTQIIDPPSSAEEEFFKVDEEIPADFSYWYFRG
jgi:hypothetical protein